MPTGLRAAHRPAGLGAGPVVAEQHQQVLVRLEQMERSTSPHTESLPNDSPLICTLPVPLL